MGMCVPIGHESPRPDQAFVSSFLPRMPTTATPRGGGRSPGIKLLPAAWHLPLTPRRPPGLLAAPDLPAVVCLTPQMR